MQYGLGTWLWCGSTCGALLPTPSVEARPHQHRDRSAARGATTLARCVRIIRRASRARIAPWSSGRRTDDHAPGTAELAWLCCGPTRGALHPHAVGRGSTAPTLRKVVSTAFERSWRLRSNSVARGPREFRAVENRPTAGDSHAVQRGVGVVVLWANARRAPSRRRRSRLNRTINVRGQQHGLREVLTTAIEPRGTWLVRISPRGESANRRRSTRCAARTLAWL